MNQLGDGKGKDNVRIMMKNILKEQGLKRNKNFVTDYYKIIPKH